MWPCWGRSQPLLVSPRSDLSRGSTRGALWVAANRCTSRCPPAQPRNSVFSFRLMEENNKCTRCSSAGAVGAGCDERRLRWRWPCHQVAAGACPKPPSLGIRSPNPALKPGAGCGEARAVPPACTLLLRAAAPGAAGLEGLRCCPHPQKDQRGRDHIPQAAAHPKLLSCSA